MAWFKRNPFRMRRRPARRKLVPVAEIVEQGLLVADVAVRMTVKNNIILNALRDYADYNEDEIVEMVRAAIVDVAVERERDANHIRRVREEVKQRGYSSWIDSDYRGSDDRTLRHREAVYDGVAAELRSCAEDASHLEKTAERARQAAWREIADSLKRRASEPYYGGGNSAEYAKERDARIEELIAEDIAALLAEREPEAPENEPADPLAESPTESPAEAPAAPSAGARSELHQEPQQ